MGGSNSILTLDPFTKEGSRGVSTKIYFEFSHAGGGGGGPQHLLQITMGIIGCGPKLGVSRSN